MEAPNLYPYQTEALAQALAQSGGVLSMPIPWKEKTVYLKPNKEGSEGGDQD